MFGDNSDGFLNETKIINYLNNTKYFDKLNENFKNFLSFLFNQDLNGTTINCYKPKGQVKPDIAIQIGEITKYVSVKKGGSNSVHQEKLADFEVFLYSCGISGQTINYLKEFHYGDNTIDGTGSVRIKAAQWQKQNSEKIYKINKDLNNEVILLKLLYRFLFIGNIPNAPVVDAMYHGNIEEGLWASKDEIILYLLSINNSVNDVHFSNLTYQAWNRNLKFNPNTENRRHVIQIKWQKLTKNLINITNGRQ